MKKPEISIETKRLVARLVDEVDKECYMKLRQETSDVKTAYNKIPGFREKQWKDELYSENDLFFSVFIKDTGFFVAIGSLQDMNTECVELGFDVVKEYRNKGYATEFVKGMLQVSKQLFPDKVIKIRTNVENKACRRVAEKCGGCFQGYEPTQVANVIADLVTVIDDRDGASDDWKKTREEHLAYIEKNREAICIYSF